MQSRPLTPLLRAVVFATALGVLATSVGLPVVRAAEAPASAFAAPKDIVLLSFDALRQDHISAFGYARPTTPTLEWLASHGTALRDVVPAGLSTKTSLTSLLTTLEYRSHRILEKNEHLPPSITTVAEALHEQGYATAGFVATPHLSAELGYAQGFDRYEDFAKTGKHFVSAAEVRDKVLAYLAEPLPAGRRARFVYVHILEPHPPWLDPSPWLVGKEGGKRIFSCVELPPPAKIAKVTPERLANLVAKYDGAILAGDRALGEIVEKLRQTGALERTVIGVTTDHGLELLDRYSASHGWNPFEEVARGFLVLYDGSRPWGPAPKLQARNVDVLPTLVARAGAARHPAFQGVDVFGAPGNVPEIAIAEGNHCAAVRTLTHKLIWIDFPSDVPLPASLHRGFALFDLRADPGETKDVQSEQPAVFAKLRDAFLAFQKDVAGKVDDPADPKHQQGLSPEARERLEALGYVE